ncbi:MAG: hypothetical protein PHQ34_02560 [Methanothrix sp.]|nr:hypothetical protein [Methanothrix sp.]
MALKKPVIILNLSNYPDIVDYVKEKVAVGVYDRKNLRETILRLNDNDSELQRNRDSYITRNLYRIDGKATDRVIDMIDKMINSREHTS